MEWATASFTMTLVDAPPLTMLSDTELINAACDAVLAVVRTRRAPREVVEQAASRIEKQKLLGVVLNCVDVSRTNGYGRYYNSYTRRP
jgi:Mrp family chromosome partitioning ATPase